MRWLSLVTPADDEPISLEEARKHLKIDDDVTADDDLIEALLVAARERAELETNRQLIRAGYQLMLSGFPCDGRPIELPRPPLLDVTSITYVDTAGATQTWSADEYQVLKPTGLYAARGLVLPRYGYTYPSTLPETLAAVTVAFAAGYGTVPASVPKSINQAQLLMVGDWYRFREQLVVGDSAATLPLPVGAAALLRPFRSGPTQ